MRHCGARDGGNGMRTRGATRVGVIIIVAASCALGAARGTADAQAAEGDRTTPPRRPALNGQAGERVTIAEVQRLFDAYTIMQAEEALKLSESQYQQFLTRLKTLQEVRRRHQSARNQIVLALQRMVGPKAESFDEIQVKDRLRALAELDARTATELRDAYDALDQVLDVRQQARFRVLEEQLERRKFDLLARARRAGAGAAAGAPPPIK
jgi:hypothetical protein